MKLFTFPCSIQEEEAGLGGGPVTAPLFTDIRFMFSEPPTAGEASVCRTPFTAEAAKADEVIRLTANRATFGPRQPGSSLAHHHHANHLSQHTWSEGSATGNCDGTFA